MIKMKKKENEYLIYEDFVIPNDLMSIKPQETTLS